MFENIVNFFKNIGKKEENKKTQESSKDAAKERLHLVLMQDRANVSADFLELMKQEIIDVIKKYIEVDEKEIDVRLTNKENEDGTNGAPALYANIPILNIKNDARKIGKKEVEEKENKPKNEQEAKEQKNAKIKEQPQEIKENEKEEQQKEIEAKEKIQEIIDGVIEEAENSKTENEEAKTNQEEQNNVVEESNVTETTNEEEQQENKEKVKSEN